MPSVQETDLDYFAEDWRKIAGLPAPAQDAVLHDLTVKRAEYSPENEFADAEGRAETAAFLTIKEP